MTENQAVTVSGEKILRDISRSSLVLMVAFLALSGLGVNKIASPPEVFPVPEETASVVLIVELPAIEEEYYIKSGARLFYEDETVPVEAPVVGDKDQKQVAEKTKKTESPARPAVKKQAAAPVVKIPGLPDLKTINEELKAYGKFLNSGMPENIYLSAMEQEWKRVPGGTASNLLIDLKKKYTYKDLEAFMLCLAAYDGVDLHEIGRSQQGRSLYNVSIDFQTDVNKKIVLLTGQVHANEFAGSLFILKQFAEIIQEAQSDAYTRLLLDHVSFKAIPVVNPDGRELVLSEGNSGRKSNARGVDLNRNFPSVNASQLSINTAITDKFSSSPGLRYYAGQYLGSESETRAVMKWMHTYIPVASYYLDYHQQGQGIYCGKAWSTIKSQQIYRSFTKSLLGFLNWGLPSAVYIHIANSSSDGFNGAGGTTAEYAASIAMGMQYSPKYGVLTLDVNGTAMPLVRFKSLEAFKEFYQPLNEHFSAVTLEICKGSQALGYAPAARNLMDQEYKKYNYDKLLKNLAELALGEAKVSELKKQF